MAVDYLGWLMPIHPSCKSHVLIVQLMCVLSLEPERPCALGIDLKIVPARDQSNMLDDLGRQCEPLVASLICVLFDKGISLSTLLTAPQLL